MGKNSGINEGNRVTGLTPDLSFKFPSLADV